MDNRTFYGILLIILYLLYLKYHNSDIVQNLLQFNNIEPFRTSSTQSEIYKLYKSLNLLKANIVDLASVAKHNTLNVCKINKSMAEMELATS